MRVHELKTWPEFFSAARSGIKRFEVRKDDRAFEVGDLLVLREFEPGKTSARRYAGYTGEWLAFRVSYVLHAGEMKVRGGLVPHSRAAIAHGYVVLGLDGKAN